MKSNLAESRFSEYGIVEEISVPGLKAVDDFSETLQKALKDCESGTSRSKNAGFNLLNRKIRQLWDLLNLASSVPPLGKKEVLIWVLLEIIDTDVGINELSKWVCNEATLDDIIFGGEKDLSSIHSYFKPLRFDEAKKRINQLTRKHL